MPPFIHQRLPGFLSGCFAAALLLLPCVLPAEDVGRVYELRTYVTNDGKLGALLKRFRDHTCRLFEKHGMENIGYWVPLEKADGSDNTLIYIIAHQSREAARAGWKAFGADPEWQAARKASEEGGKILARPPESVFLAPTSYSPPLKIGKMDKERVFELRTYTTPPGRLADLNARFQNHTLGLFSKHGMTHVAYWMPLDGEKDAGTRLIYILAHDSKQAGLASFAAFRADPAWIKAKAESEKDGPLTVSPGGVKSIYLRAVDFSPLR
ncbi:MAG: hypothetical protein CJBNEKGG_02951 [Prosthecobacter sp.]|nr:hypothetical protein [Prosthecobacter sp.]